MEQQIFRRGSTTYYFAAKFFPKSIRQDVFDPYSFVRLADDYVDATPIDKDGFYRLRRMWLEAQNNLVFSTAKQQDDSHDTRAIKNIVRLHQEQGIKKQWINEFLDAMQSDIVFQNKQTLEKSLNYTYGSAEVVGLMMARLMDLPKEAYATAKLQGRAMQWINFIRDIEEDNQLGRQYFPTEELIRFNLKDLSRTTAAVHPDEFQAFVRFQIERYKTWQSEAEEGYKFTSKRYLVPIKTAADMYKWTAEQIQKNPSAIFQAKIRPGKGRVVVSALKNAWWLLLYRR